MTPAVYGFAFEPRILTMRSCSTVTVRLHVSGQSRGQTLSRSTLMGVSSAGQHGPALFPTLDEVCGAHNVQAAWHGIIQCRVPHPERPSDGSCRRGTPAGHIIGRPWRPD